MRGINHLAIVASVVAHQVLGFIWYGLLFTRPWLEGWKIDPEKVNQVDPMPFVYDIVGWIVASYVIAWLILKTNMTSAGQGALLGVALWLGVGLPTLLPHYAFPGVSETIMLIDGANVLVALVLTGVILGAWQKKAPITDTR